MQTVKATTVYSMNSFYSVGYDFTRAAWATCFESLWAIPLGDKIHLLTAISIALFARLQWRINRESSRRYFSEKLLEYFAPIQAAQRMASKMLSAQSSYNNNLALNRYSEEHDQSPLMMEQKERIKQYAGDLEKALGLAYDSMFALSLILGVHRSELSTAARRLAQNSHDKIFELLTFAQQCKVEIIDHGWLEINDKPVKPIITMSPEEALEKLNRLHIELINLLTSQYKVTNI